MLKEEAQALGVHVLDKLPTGWTATTWENLGWHVSWRRGAAQLHYTSRNKKFWSMIGEVGSAGGHMDFGGEVKHYEDPLNAIRWACRQAQKVYQSKWLPIIASVETILGELK